MTTEAKNKGGKPWATILLGIIVAAIFLAAVFSFQVDQTQSAVVTTFDKPSEEPVDPGIHFRWPYPIQEVFKFDNRYRCFDGKVGKVEETLTSDKQNVIVGIFVIYRIDKPVVFFKKLKTIADAETQLNTWMRSSKSDVIGQFAFGQLINPKPQGMKLGAVETKIKDRLSQMANNYGLEIKAVGIKSINIPESISKKVFERMKDERKAAAQVFLSEGKKEAEQIKIAANSKVKAMLADAEAKSKEIRAEGDAKAAEFYSTFKKDPELAIFLRKLDSLRKVMQSKTTLILDTNSAPFDIMKMNADQLHSVPAKAAK